MYIVVHKDNNDLTLPVTHLLADLTFVWKLSSILLTRLYYTPLTTFSQLANCRGQNCDLKLFESSLHFVAGWTKYMDSILKKQF